jgi:hypothetical protein
MLPDVSSVNQLVSLQQPFRSSDFSLLCKKWSRLAGATGKAMPCKMDVEVKGIPVHVSETSTVEQLLNPYAWIDHVHEATSELSDLSSFRCSAWCFDSNKIPPSKELWVAEPPNTILESPPVKRFLAYPIKFKTSIISPSGEAATSPPPSPPPEDESDDSDDDPSTRQRRRFTASAPPRVGRELAAGSESASYGGVGSTAQARERPTSSGSHVVESMMATVSQTVSLDDVSLLDNEADVINETQMQSKTLEDRARPAPRVESAEDEATEAMVMENGPPEAPVLNLEGVILGLFLLLLWRNLQLNWVSWALNELRCSRPLPAQPLLGLR